MYFYVYTSNVRIQLIRDLHLDGEWGIALTEIHASADEQYLLVAADFVHFSRR